MKHRIIILANSVKMRNRCIAGIDMLTGKWLRPCFGNGDEGIPSNVRQINGYEPKLLDVVEIPLETTGPNLNYQPENRALLDGSWSKIGTIKLSQLFKYCEEDDLLLYNTDRRIPLNEVLAIPVSKRKSLCLIKARVDFSTEATFKGAKRVNASFTYGSNEYCIPVKDYEFEKQFPAHSTASAECIMTVSLALPYKDGHCYKLVAGVMERYKLSD